MIESSAKIAMKVDALVEALLALSPGQTVSYAHLSKVITEPVNGGSYLLQRALDKAEKDSGAVFDNVWGKGYTRLEGKDLPGVGKKANSRIRRVARKTRKRFERVRTNDMTPEDLAKLAAYRSHFGMIEGIASERHVAGLAEVAEAVRVEPSEIAERTDAFMRKR